MILNDTVYMCTGMHTILHYVMFMSVSAGKDCSTYYKNSVNTYTHIYIYYIHILCYLILCDSSLQYTITLYTVLCDIMSCCTLLYNSVL